MEDIQKILCDFSPITLEEMDTVKLMNRNDTKFTFNSDRVCSILEEAKKYYRILEIDNQRLCSYHTIYYDTEDYSMYNIHHNGKLNRCKIRIREYIDSKKKFLEIKYKSNKRKTVKERIKIKFLDDEFSPTAVSFIEKKSSYKVKDLIPQLENQFSRLTLVNKNATERITLDMNLMFRKGDVELPLPFLAIAEVKQSGFDASSEFMKLLHKNRIQPLRISKYCIGILMLAKDKKIKYNRFKYKLLTLNKMSNDDKYSKYFIKW